MTKCIMCGKEIPKEPFKLTDTLAEFVTKIRYRLKGSVRAYVCDDCSEKICKSLNEKIETYNKAPEPKFEVPVPPKPIRNSNTDPNKKDENL